MDDRVGAWLASFSGPCPADWASFCHHICIVIFHGEEDSLTPLGHRLLQVVAGLSCQELRAVLLEVFQQPVNRLSLIV